MILQEEVVVAEKGSYLEAVHLGGALGENDAGQQEEEGVSHQGVHRLPIQQQAGVDRVHQGFGLQVKNIQIRLMDVVWDSGQLEKQAFRLNDWSIWQGRMTNNIQLFKFSPFKFIPFKIVS